MLRPPHLIPSTLLLIGLALLGGGTVLAQESETVVIGDALDRNYLEVAMGTTVTWQNKDRDRHRIRSQDGPVEFDSGNLESGESFSFTFETEGSYPYVDHRDRGNTAYFGTVVVGDPASVDTPPASSGEVTIVDRTFGPAALTVTSGAKVEWRNADGEAHTVTSTDGSFDSGIVDEGGAFSQTFESAGTFAYFCAIHPEMRGTVVVADPGVEPEADREAVADADPAAEQDAAQAAAAAEPMTVEPAAVSIANLAFDPATVEVEVGETLAWTNEDGFGHTVTATEGGFASEILAHGDQFSQAFTEPGAFDYFCAIHPSMTGSVVVTVPG